MAELFRFRCPRCQKLMGAPATTFGKTASCPRCGAELVVPSPDDAADEGDGDGPDFGIDLGDLGDRLVPSPPRKAPPSPLRDPDFAASRTNPIAFLEASPADGEEDPPGADEPADPEEGGPVAPIDVSRRVSPITGKKPLPIASDPPGRRRDVVLPRTVVLAWALGALLGLGFAFLAGLMIGHYLW